MIQLPALNRLKCSVLIILIIICFNNCSREKNGDFLKLDGKWIYSDCQGKSIALWFYKDELLWYQKSMNTMFHKKYSIKNKRLEIFEMDGSISVFPFTGEFYIKDNQHFWLSSTPEQVLIFERKSNEIDSLEFYTVDDTYFTKRFY